MDPDQLLRGEPAFASMGINYQSSHAPPFNRRLEGPLSRGGIRERRASPDTRPYTRSRELFRSLVSRCGADEELPSGWRPAGLWNQAWPVAPSLAAVAEEPNWVVDHQLA